MFVDKNISMNKIAKTLNERKVPTKKNSGSWEAFTIKQILSNPTYIGKVRYSISDKNRYFEADGHHEKILTDEIFYLAQDKIKNKPNISRTKNAKEDNYFCGFLVCGICGGKFSSHNVYKTNNAGEKHATRSYRCVNRIYHNDDIACKSPQIIHEKVELAFSEYIQKIGDLTETENENIEETAKHAEQELLKSIVDCEKRLTVLHDRKKQIMAQYVNGLIEFDEYKKMLSIMNESYDALDKELELKKSQILTVKEKSNLEPQDIVNNLKENWDSLSKKERAVFLQRFIKKIVITVEKEKQNSNIVKIESVEFNTDSAIAISQNRPSLRENLRER
jgi:hypothetical protein